MSRCGVMIGGRNILNPFSVGATNATSVSDFRGEAWSVIDKFRKLGIEPDRLVQAFDLNR